MDAGGMDLLEDEEVDQKGNNKAVGDGCVFLDDSRDEHYCNHMDQTNEDRINNKDKDKH